VLYQCTITHSIGVEIHENWSTAKERKTFHSPTSEDRFSAIKYAVVEFIKWHNTNKE
jgi:hypothetical protein